MVPDWTFNLLYEPFKKHGETFLTVSPDKTLAWITTAEAINQITQRREAFPKPLESYAVLEIYGQNIVSTEGLNWRAHRKVLSPGFNEKNNALVFTEAVAQTQGMLGKWTAGGNATLKDVPTDTMRLTLHIISRVGFGVRLLWPEEEPRKGDKLSGINFGGNDPPKGHSMSFEHALSTLLDNLIWVLLVPSWLLSEFLAQRSPLPRLTMHRAYTHQECKGGIRILHQLGPVHE